MNSDQSNLMFKDCKDSCDDCEQEDPKAKSNRLLAQDMMDFEECINMIGIETRTEDGDSFRNFWSIIRDIGTLIKNNPTILNDIEGKNFKTVDEQLAFLLNYNFDGVTVVPCLREGHK